MKLPIYAEAGIPEYWLVDVRAQQLECYTDPQASSSTYANKETFVAGDTYRHELLGELVIAGFLGKPAS